MSLVVGRIKEPEEGLYVRGRGGYTHRESERTIHRKQLSIIIASGAMASVFLMLISVGRV